MENYPYADLITLVIPAKDEARSVAGLIELSKEFAGEIILVDGHSQDGTAEVAERAGARVIFDNGKGKGDAIRTAIGHIHNEITVFMDADGSHLPSDIPALVAPIVIDGADHVSGSRLIGGSSELHGGFDECFRLMGTSFITACINWKFKCRLSDSQNGFRAIRTRVLRTLNLRESITTIEQEMVIKTLKKGFKLVEVPAHEYKRKFGASHIRLRRVWFRYGYSLVKYLLF